MLSERDLKEAAKVSRDKDAKQKRKQEKKLLVDAVKDLRRRLRRTMDAERKRASVADFWAPNDERRTDETADPNAAAPSSDDPDGLKEDHHGDGDDWLSAYLRAADDDRQDSDDSDAEDKRRPPNAGWETWGFTITSPL